MTNEKMEKLKETKQDNIVSEEELHEVDGGFGFGDGYSGWANSSRFLNVLLGEAVCDRYGRFRAGFHAKEIISAWAKVGVEVDHGMVFKINGKEVNEKEAFEHAMNVTGKHLQPKDWLW